MSPVDKGPVANTDQEIFQAAFTDEEPDFDDTDRSPEEMGDGPEGQHEPEDEGTEEVAAAEGEPEKPADGETGKAPDKPAEPEEPELPTDPVGMRAAMVAERKARQAAEAAARTSAEQSRAELAAANARIDRLLAQAPRAEQSAPQAPRKPDPVLDPDGYERYVVAQAEQRVQMMRIEQTFAETHEVAGKEFEAAVIELQKLDPNNLVDRATGNRIYTAAHPGKALLRWHREQSLLRETGGDPAAYRQRLRDELVDDPDMVKAVLARQRELAEGGAPNAPRSVTRLPPSLNRARGGSNDKTLGAADNTDAAVFDYAMNG